MHPEDTVAELGRLLKHTPVRECRLLKRGLRADAYHVFFDDGVRGTAAIAKRFRELDDFSAGEAASYRLFRDRGLDVAPPLIAVADDGRWLVLETVQGDDLMATLRRFRDPAAQIVGLAHTVAKLVLGTRGAQPGHDGTRHREADALSRGWPAVLDWAAKLGARSSDGVLDDVAALLDRYRDPPVLAWTQGDPAPSNVLFTPEGAVLVDFEYGAPRHALHDLAQWLIRCPLPLDWFSHLEQTVGNALVGERVYSDTEAYRHDLACMAAYAALYMYTWVPIGRALGEDVPWAPGFPARRAVVSTTRRLGLVLTRCPELPALAEWAGAVARALAGRWPEAGDGEIDWASAARPG